jgi:hypothetical protein
MRFDHTAGLLREAPSLCSASDGYCKGCGEPKESSSLVCCRGCWRRLPKWLRHAFTREPCAKWENRIAAILIWTREALKRGAS